MRKVIMLLPAVLAFSLIGCQPLAERTAEQEWINSGAPLLTADQISQLYSGSEVSWVGTKFRGTALYNEDGTVSAAWDTGSATGTWRILDNKLCTTFAKVRSGRETCYHVYDNSDGSFEQFYSNGDRATTDRVYHR